MKKFSTFLCALALLVVCLLLLPTEAKAASQSDLSFLQKGTGYFVRYCKNTANGALTIPATYNGKPVTGIVDYAFSDCTGLTSITIPDSVTTIGNFAFAYCAGLTKVDIPSSVTSIGHDVFRRCTSLTSVTIPGSITTISDAMFAECTRLASVTIGKGVTTIGTYAFDQCTSLTSVTIPDSVTTLNPSVFNYCTSLASVIIPDSVTDLGFAAFDHCTSLTSVTIPDSVTVIGYSMFDHCTSLSNVTIPDSITTIDTYAFYYCTSLTSVTIPDSVTSIDSDAFSFCTGLTSVTIGSGVTTLGGTQFRNSIFNGCSALTAIQVDEANPNYCSDNGVLFNKDKTALITVPGGFATYTIPSSVTMIDNYAFANSVLTEITIPSNVTAIGNYAFIGCSDMTKVTIPGSVKTIGESAFQGCSSLTSVIIPHGVAAIGNQAFYVCRSLTSVTIPNSVTTIGDRAFQSCTSLTGITIPDSVTTIGVNAFNNCTGLTKVSIPSSVTTVCGFGDCTNLTDVQIADGVAGIGYYAFSGCTGLTKITLPDSVTAIDSYAFIGCAGLSHITIPDGVTYFGDQAFAGCLSLKSIKIPEGVTNIGQSAFSGCTGLTSVTIPDSVTSMGYSVFSGCTGLKSVTLSKGVKQILNRTFQSCNSLTDVYYNGTRTSWDGIKIYDYNTALQNATLHFVLCETNGHTYNNSSDAVCNICSFTRQMVDTYKFENYRVVFKDPDTAHKNVRVELYELGNKTVSDPSDEKALKAIDASPVTHWGAGNINKILITDAGNYVLLLKYNVGTAAATKVPLRISVSSDPKLIIDKNNKLTAIDKDGANINHRVVVYYLGDKTVADIYNETALKAMDKAPDTVWQKTRINKLALTKGGNYVLHLCYNVGTGAKQTVAQQFTVESIPTLSVNQNNMLIASEENAENRNHRVTVFSLGSKTVEDIYDESAVKAAAVSSKTYWGLSEINKAEIKEGGNYIFHLYYNVGTSAKRTLAIEATLTERPKLSVSKDNKLVVTYSDASITNPRAYIYNVGDAEVADIYDETALKKIATPTQVWGIGSILKKQLTPGTYVIHLHYNVDGGAKSTVALQITIP